MPIPARPIVVPPGNPRLEKLVPRRQEGDVGGHPRGEVRRAAWPISAMPSAHLPRSSGYTLIRNLASHGVGDSLHDEPGEIPTWPDRSERRRIADGLVFTIEPFPVAGRPDGRGQKLGR